MYRCSETNIDQKLPFKTSAPTIIRNCLQRVFWNHWRIKFHHKKIRVVKNCLSHAGKPQWNQISLYQISCIDETKSFVRAFFTKISLELHFDPFVEKYQNTQIRFDFSSILNIELTLTALYHIQVSTLFYRKGLIFLS